MSFVPISSFLTRAFSRIDKSCALEETQETARIRAYFDSVLRDGAGGEYTLSLRRGVLTIASASPHLKHKFVTSQTTLLEALKKQKPAITVKNIVFTGPRLRK